MNINGISKKLLLIDGNPSHARVIESALVAGSDGPVHLVWCRTLSDGLKRLSDKRIRAVLLHLSLPDSQGIETFDRVFLAASPLPILVLGGLGDEDIAKEAIRHGAQDYLLEGHLDSYLLPRAVRTMIERKATEEALFIEKERAQVTLNSIGDAVLSTDIFGNVTYLNVAAENMTGWSRMEASGRPVAEVFQIFDGASHELARNPMELAIQQDRIVGLTTNCIMIRRDGFESAIEDSAAPIHDRDGKVTGAVMVFHDVSVAREMAIQMSHLAQHDCLTDLPNRILLKDRLTQAKEFVLHYQPKVNLRTGEITGAEALIRWLHPDLGVLPPLQFVPIAEDSGLILPIGRWVLREACRQARAWLNEGLRAIPVGINISSLEFRSNGFLEGVRAILKDTHLEPCYLELEMTEGVLMQHADSTASMLKALKVMGVHLTVDDFGTGYSSLSYLTRFPIDALKLDQSFVHKITPDTEHAAIINAVISMAKSLKQRVIAEGVETAEQLAFLRAQACDEGQGYYFGPAVIPEQFAKLLELGISATPSN